METFQTTQKQISEFDKLSNNIGLAQIEQYWGELIQTLRIMKIRSSQGCNDIDTQGIYLKNIQEYWRQYQKSLSEVLWSIDINSIKCVNWARIEYTTLDVAVSLKQELQQKIRKSARKIIEESFWEGPQKLIQACKENNTPIRQEIYLILTEETQEQKI